MLSVTEASVIQVTEMRKSLWLRIGAHIIGLCTTVFTASVVAWGTWQVWSVWSFPGYGSLIVLVSIAYLASLLLTQRFFQIARANSIALVGVYVLIGCGFTFAFIILSRWYYSRSFLIVGFLMTFLWQLLIHSILVKRLVTIAVVPGGFSDRLFNLSQVNWVSLKDPADKNMRFDAIAVDFYTPLNSSWQRFIAESGLRDIPMLHASTIYESITGRVSLDWLSLGILKPLSGNRNYEVIKRWIDCIVVVVFSPALICLCALVAVAVKLDSRGPVLFWQERIGKNGKVFRMVKFRSMRIDAESRGERFAGQNDIRVTQIGRVIRKFRLDEIPQFWNVLRGEMSIIGPRPEQVRFAENFAECVPLYPYRHLVRPGLTGWAQVTQGYASGLDETLEKLEFDLYYVKHLSAWLDFLVVLKTIQVVFSGFGSR